MAEFALPKNSKIKPGGKVHKAAADAKNVKTFKVYRYDPESGENPRYDSFEIDLDDTGPMVLDALINRIPASPSAVRAARGSADPAR